MKKLLTRRRRDSDEAGQMLVLFAGGMVVLVALLALSIDVGRLVVTRSNLQNSADAAALAAAQELPSSGTARSIGEQYADANVSGSGAMGTLTGRSVDISSTNTSNDTVTVRIERSVPYVFGRLVGLDQADVSATARARIAYYSGGIGMEPWGLIAGNQNPCYRGTINGVPRFRVGMDCKIKDGAPGNGGDFGALELDGTGANNYRDDIINGSDRKVSLGDKLKPEPGNMAGPTRQGIQSRLNRPRPAGCPGDSFDDIFRDNGDGTYSIRPGCADHPRIIIIPVVDQIDHQKMSTVLGFAFMYIYQWEEVPDSVAGATAAPAESLAAPGNGNGNGNGNGQGQVAVYARFVDVVTEIPGGDYSGTTPTGASIVRLVN